MIVDTIDTFEKRPAKGRGMPISRSMTGQRIMPGMGGPNIRVFGGPMGRPSGGCPFKGMSMPPAGIVKVIRIPIGGPNGPMGCPFHRPNQQLSAGPKMAGPFAMGPIKISGSGPIPDKQAIEHLMASLNGIMSKGAGPKGAPKIMFKNIDSPS